MAIPFLENQSLHSVLTNSNYHLYVNTNNEIQNVTKNHAAFLSSEIESVTFCFHEH